MKCGSWDKRQEAEKEGTAAEIDAVPVVVMTVSAGHVSAGRDRWKGSMREPGTHLASAFQKAPKAF